MFPGLRKEVSEILAIDFCNLQVLHEALDQPGGLIALADYVAARLGEEQLLIARDLRQFKEHTNRDMLREKRLIGRGARSHLRGFARNVCKPFEA